MQVYDGCICRVLKRGSYAYSVEPTQVAAADPNACYALGSVLNHVLLHQTIIGEEALLQLAKIGETPDLVVSGAQGHSSGWHGATARAQPPMHATQQQPVVAMSVQVVADTSLSVSTHHFLC